MAKKLAIISGTGKVRYGNDCKRNQPTESPYTALPPKAKTKIESKRVGDGTLIKAYFAARGGAFPTTRPNGTIRTPAKSLQAPHTSIDVYTPHVHHPIEPPWQRTLKGHAMDMQKARTTKTLRGGVNTVVQATRFSPARFLALGTGRRSLVLQLGPSQHTATALAQRKSMRGRTNHTILVPLANSDC